MYPYPVLIVASESGTTHAAKACDQRQLIEVLDKLFGKGFHAHCTDFMQQLERGERVDDCVGDGCSLVIYPRVDLLPKGDVMWKKIETAPRDGTEVLLKTHVGIVSAWFCNAAATNDAGDDGCYDWICYDGMFTLDGDDSTIEGWAPLPS